MDKEQPDTRHRPVFPTILIVVATYKRPNDLRTFLQSMVPQIRGRRHVRLVVINDGTHDAAYAHVVEPYQDTIDYRPHPVNLGPGPIRMVACENATEEYIVFTDDDCIATPGWFDWLEAMIQTFPEVDLFAGTTEPVNSPRPGLVEKYLCLAETFPKPFVTKRGLVVAVTANFAAKRELFEQVGGFHPDFNLTSEDLNLTHRLLEAGASYRVCNDWVIGHTAEQTFRATLSRFYNYGFGGAQHVICTKDWRFADEAYRGTSVREALPAIRAWMDGRRHDSKMKVLPAPLRLLYRGMAAMIAVQYFRGWHAGLRHHSRRYDVEIPGTRVMRRSLASFIEYPASPAGADGMKISTVSDQAN